jgi:hypothetical protein
MKPLSACIQNNQQKPLSRPATTFRLPLLPAATACAHSTNAMIIVCVKIALFVLLLAAQQTIEVDASHGIVNISKRRSSSSPKHSISVRGGSSASASSWSAGSRYDYRTTRPSSSARNYQAAPFTSGPQSTLDTKEVFAEAFLRREDRNRFIGASNIPFV